MDRIVSIQKYVMVIVVLSELIYQKSLQMNISKGVGHLNQIFYGEMCLHL
jgi:hypothetical protein